MKTAYQIDENKAAEVLGAKDGKASGKKAIVAVISPNVTKPLVYDTILASGKTEVESATLDSGDFLAVGAGKEGVGGEAYQLASAKIGKLYDTENPLDFDDATKLANERNIAITGQGLIMDAIAMLRSKNEGVDLSNARFDYLDAQGRVKAFKMPVIEGLEIKLPKASWGSVQEGDADCVIVFNLTAPGAYLIGKQEYIDNYGLEETPGLEGEELWKELDSLSVDELDSMVV